MNNMFYYAEKFNQKIGDNWNTSHVTSMHGMFYGAKNFNQKIGDDWDTSNVIDMKYMFWYATNLEQKIGNNWDVSKLNSTISIFPKDFNPKYLPKWLYKKIV